VRTIKLKTLILNGPKYREAYIEFKEDADGEAAITQENHYYPFGMRFSGEVFANNDNDFRYNAEKPEISDFIVLDNPEQATPLFSTKL